MPMMDVMDAVVGVMEDEGVEVAFGVPGAAILPVYKALSKSNQIRHYSVRHEEGGTHAADGYARVTGKVGINIGTSGPAGTNMITGLYTCMADSIPQICITGQAPTTVLHKVAFDPGRGGPLHFEKPAPRPNAVRQAVEMILEAERPVLMPGGGVIIADASEELVELAEYLQVPVSPTYMGKGAINEDHELYAGIVGLQTQQRYANALFLESDLVVGIGNRWADRHTGDLDVYRGDRKFIHIDIDPRQMGRVFPPDLAVVSDARLALEAMREVAGEMMPAQEPGEWAERVDEL